MLNDCQLIMSSADGDFFMKRKKDWIKFKRYPHIGEPVSFEKLGPMLGYIKNPEKIAHHAFFPLIHRKMVSYPAKGKGKDRKRQRKVRDICYATHLDAQIYSYYNDKLSKAYERKLTELSLGDVVVAYRSIPTEENPDVNKSHIHFAKEAFDFIRKKIVEVEAVSVVVSDISGFFDNLDHKLLKERWKEILDVGEMTNDVYNVYRNLTHFSYIDEWRLLQELKNEVIVRDSKANILKRKKVRQKRHYRDNDVVAFCERSDITKLRHLITCRPFKCKDKEYKRELKGIPQGLPISATLANVYMLSFDIKMKAFAEQKGGFYRRYSDDIVLIVPGMDSTECVKKLDSEIMKVNLTIQQEKNKVRIFYKENGVMECVDPNPEPKKSKLEYLGFSFDGKKILLKSKSINHYYLKQERAIKRSLGYAKSIDNPTRGKLFENRLLHRFTRIGSRVYSPANPISEEKRRMLEGQRKKSPQIFVKRKIKYGNFHTYVARAARIMESPEIKAQLSSNLRIMRARIKDAKKQLIAIPRYEKKKNSLTS